MCNHLGNVNTVKAIGAHVRCPKFDTPFKDASTLLSVNLGFVKSLFSDMILRQMNMIFHFQQYFFLLAAWHALGLRM